ncbi:hypothetical protein ACI3PF_20740, partial [Lactococcus lactis]
MGNNTGKYLQAVGLASQLAAQASAAQGNAAICAASSALSAAIQAVTLMKGDACEGKQRICLRSCANAIESANNERQAEMAKGA